METSLPWHACACGAQALRATHDTAKERLEGLYPVLEDCHARNYDNIIKGIADTYNNNDQLIIIFP